MFAAAPGLAGSLGEVAGMPTADLRFPRGDLQSGSPLGSPVGCEGRECGRRSVCASDVVTARQLSSAVGLMDSVADLVQLGRWRVRPLHWARKVRWSQTTGSFDDLLPPLLPADCAQIQWWLGPENLLHGVPIQDSLPDGILFSDASLMAWGARLESHVASGVWSEVARTWHINVLEAVLRALRCILPWCSN